MNAFQSFIGNLISVNDYIRMVVVFCDAIPSEEKIELLDGCSCLVAFAFVIPEIEERRTQILIFDTRDDR